MTWLLAAFGVNFVGSMWALYNVVKYQKKSAKLDAECVRIIQEAAVRSLAFKNLLDEVQHQHIAAKHATLDRKEFN